MKSLPRRKKHRQTRHQSRERSESCTAQSHSRNFQERSESTIQTIDSVVEKFSEPGTGACASGLFAVDVVHCGVEPDSQRVGVEWPGGGGAEEEWVREVQEEDVEEDEEEAEESYHVGGEPEGEVFDAEIPLLYTYTYSRCGFSFCCFACSFTFFHLFYWGKEWERT